MNKRIFIATLALLTLVCTNHLALGMPRTDTSYIKEVDEAVGRFMAEYGVPGAAVAITKDGKLVYAKGYGYADTLRKEKVHPGSLFRIASISKPITATTIMKLVEEGKLSLDQRVFGPEGVLGTRYGTAPYKQPIPDITIRHLLQHTSGGWGNARSRGRDPMFLDATWSMDKLIDYTLDSIPLDQAPGERYVYSNFGYCLLGRVIEAVSMQPYEEYVKKTILLPLGITDMRIGGNTLDMRLENEVVYYGRKSGGLHPYIYNITRMDAHGGWVASAVDLVRLLVHVDGFATKKDILSASSVRQMAEVSTAADNTTYAHGWRVDEENNWWHSGSLPGTGTHLSRRANGFNWTVLTNTRLSGGSFFADLESLLNDIIADPAIVWTDTDGF
ncbi:serine hydrolase domain-containing protein [Parapedobacter tibetensis]|uniref:serine hydrolase domain-containing protein n=1 Tax=Parapedobacter tibetensis TaxID=2972951 RepID=UPI00214D69F2|nr:serine hydrolase domain-containing protein [Parapedobacter tibetensis]